MGFFDNLRKQAVSQFVEILEWLDDTPDSLVYRFPVYDQQIKMGAQLVVRENQQALLVNEGKAADLFRTGTHTIATRNVPVLAALKGWKYGFHSPFKAEVYFFNMRLFTDLKWGTSQPVMMRDAEFGMLRLRAHGTYAIRVADAKKLFSEIVGTRGLTTTEEITGQLRSIIVTRFSDAVAEAKIQALDLAANLDELSRVGSATIGPEFSAFGIELSRFFVESLSLPEEVQAMVDQRTRLGVLGDRIPQFVQMQAAEAITIAAGASGGAAGAGVGLGTGLAVGQMMGQALTAGPGRGAGAPGSQGQGAAAAPRWTLNIEGRNFGPYSEQALGEMIRSGQIDPATLAWKPDAPGWAPVSSYDELKAWAPPPAPGPGAGPAKK